MFHFHKSQTNYFKKIMATSKRAITSSKSILNAVTLQRCPWIYSTFLTSTRPLQEAKIDKQTAEKIKEAAAAVTEGAKTVVRVGKTVEDTVSSGAKNVITEVAKKTFEKVTETDKKSAWEKAREVIKEKIIGK